MSIPEPAGPFPGIAPHLIPDRIDGFPLAPNRVNFTRFTGAEAPDVWAMTVDTVSGRTVALFTPEDLIRVCRAGLRAVDPDSLPPDGIVLASNDDLRGLSVPDDLRGLS